MNQLSMEQIRTMAPQAFATQAKPGLSDKYLFLPTSQIIEDMSRLGWKVSAAKSSKYRNKDLQDYGTHFIGFFHPDIYIRDAQGEIEAYPQVVVFNSHSGRGSFKFELGIFRLICSNGMVVKSTDLGSFQLRHKGYTFEQLQVLIGEAVERMPQLVGRINTFGQRIMSPEEQLAFAQQAFSLRSDRQLTEADLAELLEPRRVQDRGDSLWLVLNRIQEGVLRGGFQATNSKGKLRTVKGIRNIQRDLQINQDLWEMAETYC